MHNKISGMSAHIRKVRWNQQITKLSCTMSSIPHVCRVCILPAYSNHHQQTAYISRTHTQTHRKTFSKHVFALQHNSQTIRTTHMSTHNPAICTHTHTLLAPAGMDLVGDRDVTITSHLLSGCVLRPCSGHMGNRQCVSCWRVSYYVCGIAE